MERNHEHTNGGHHETTTVMCEECHHNNVRCNASHKKGGQVSHGRLHWCGPHRGSTIETQVAQSRRCPFTKRLVNLHFTIVKVSRQGTMQHKKNTLDTNSPNPLVLCKWSSGVLLQKARLQTTPEQTPKNFSPFFHCIVCASYVWLVT